MTHGLRNQTVLVGAVVAILTAIIMTMAFWVTYRGRDLREQLEDSVVPATTSYHELMAAYVNQNTALREYLADPDIGINPYQVSAQDADLARVRLRRLVRAIRSPELTASINQLLARHDAVVTHVDQPEITAMSTGHRGRALRLQFQQATDPDSYILRQRLAGNDFEQQLTQEQISTLHHIASYQKRLLGSLIVLALLGIAAATAAVYALFRWVLGPMARMRDAAKTVSAGEHDLVMPATGPTELAELGRSLEVMRVKLTDQLQFLSERDPLTGLYNRQRFSEMLEQELARVERYGGTGAVLVMDLDHFKSVNDTLGHSIGDGLIARTAFVARQPLRRMDTITRLGGDEFAFLLPGMDETKAVQTAARVLDALRSEEIQTPHGLRRISASIGVTTFDCDNLPTTEQLLVQADIAMYDAKDAGRNCCRVYDAHETRQAKMLSRLNWADQIERALEDDRFVLHAQPILSLDGLDTCPRHELLLRMVDEDGDLIQPGQFLGIAERHGLIRHVDRWVLDNAAALLAAAQKLDPSTCLQVNLSAASLSDPTLVQLISDRCSTDHADPRGLCVEITETVAIGNLEQAQRFAHELADLGCKLALDDFGAGFATFSYLKHLNFDFLKIDGEFVEGLGESMFNQLVVRSVVDIARGLGRQTIAEFVDGEATLSTLRAMGVGYVQGYYVGTPMPVAGDDLSVTHSGPVPLQRRLLALPGGGDIAASGQE